MRTLKQMIFSLLRLNQTKRWIGPVLDEVVAHYNQQPAHNTRFKRTKVNSANWLSFLSEYLGVPRPSHAMALSGVESQELGGLTKYGSKIWKIPLGTPVLLHRSGYSDTKVKHSKLKRSVVGSAGEDVFYVHAHLLKSSNGLALVPVYKLRTGPNEDAPLKRGYFYSRFSFI